MNNKLIIYITSMLALGLFSCEKTLDVQPTNQVDASTSIKTPADAQIMINGIMRSMSSSDYYGRKFILYGDAKGGDMTIHHREEAMMHCIRLITPPLAVVTPVSGRRYIFPCYR
jgi:hypothetical protein